MVYCCHNLQYNAVRLYKNFFAIQNGDNKDTLHFVALNVVYDDADFKPFSAY